MLSQTSEIQFFINKTNICLKSLKFYDLSANFNTTHYISLYQGNEN